MSFLSELVEKAKGFLGNQPRNVHTDAIDHDRFDAQVYDELLEEAPALADMVTDLNERYDYTDDLVRDVLMEFWKGDPRMRPQEDMKPSYLANHAVAEDLHEAPNTREARSYTTHDRYGAAMATLGVSDKVRESLERYRDQAEEAQQKAEEAEQAAEQAQELAQQLAEQAEAAEATDQQAQQAQEAAEADPDDEQAQEAAQQAAQEAQAQAQTLEQMLQEAQEAAQAAEQAQGDAQQAANTVKAKVRPDVQQGVQEAQEQLAEEEDLFTAWGYGPGDLKQMDFAERARLAALLKGNKLGKYAKLLGRFRMMAAAQRTKKVEYGRDEATGVELSGDLERLVATEYTHFAVKALRRNFYLKFIEGQLLSRKYIGVEQVGMGAIIACVDTSDSMNASDANGITRDAWAKAMTLALLDQAKRSRRDFVAILFSDRGEQRKWEFPKGQGKIEDVVAMAEFMYAGGTDFMKPLNMAMDKLDAEYNADGKMKGDIVFITDGIAPINEQWTAEYLERKKRTGFRTFGIQVGEEDGIYGMPAQFGNPLEAVSDNVRQIAEFTNPSEVDDIFQVLR